MASFDGLLATIPPKIYFPPETTEYNPSIKKRKTKEEAEAKRAAKKAKFDPNIPQTVPEILASRAAAASTQSKAPQSKAKQSQSAKAQPNAQGSASIEELRDRLHAKMAALATGRKGNTASTTPSASASPAPSVVGGREALIQESQRSRAEAKEAKKREKKLAKSNAAKEFKAAMEKAQSEEPVVANGKDKGKSKAKDPEPAEDPDWEDVASTASSGPPISPPEEGAVVPASHERQADDDDNEDDIAFSSLDFKASDALRPVDVLPDLRRKPKKDAATHALNRLEEREQFLSKLTPQARERALEKDKWENAVKKASGEKVLDDPARLRKLTKKMEKSKDKSRQKWWVSLSDLPMEHLQLQSLLNMLGLHFFCRQERTAEAKEKQEQRQQKRNENVQKRVQAKRDRKNGVKPKKSKGGPSKKGFERSKPSGSSSKSDQRGKHRGSVSLAQSKGKSSSAGSRK